MNTLPRYLSNTFNIVKSKPNPIVVFGVGNYGSLTCRSSIGSRTIEYLLKGLNMKWMDFKECSTRIAYNQENHLLFIQPDTYLVKDNHEVLRRCIKLMPNIRADSFVALHYEHLYKLGVVDRVIGGRTSHNPGLTGLTSVFQTEQYHRVSMGVAHPVDDITFEHTLYSMSEVYADLQTPFLLNRFPDVQMDLVDKVVLPYACNEALIAISEIKQRNDLEAASSSKLSTFISPRLDAKSVLKM
ncbi:hypothetical protein DFA_09470 [Cavenderia fasciculata]|uniref:Uncharacterized protein n=1 Tax=Cavenderia fasciculata TaxID=261658 RepID=F4Q7Q2_CACFS|nr:uncharacterized protein DFA_09470 [Cavenderia fasciculata]EGG15802.1 hypothetical protein DFA_09470 [Cavenderia fasciculata]|eukprot:XP_004352127.1 hypothetical protein DFA_09470 [Cavenderia fasciculata]